MPGLPHAAGVLIAAFALEAGCGGSPLANSDAGLADADNVGAPCDILTDAGPKAGVFFIGSLECTSQICLKSVDYVGGVDTWPACTAACSQDSDCTGRMRDISDPNDKACVTGYTCGVAFTHGPICCVRLCLCMDFYGGPVATPDECAPPTVPGDTCYYP